MVIFMGFLGRAYYHFQVFSAAQLVLVVLVAVAVIVRSTSK